MNTDIDPLQLGAQSGLLWRQGDMVLAGVGVATRITFDRPGGAKDAQRKLASLVGSSEVPGLGTGPVGFASLAFDPQQVGELIVPTYVVGQRQGGAKWVTYTGDAPFDESKASGVFAEMISRAEQRIEPPSEYRIQSKRSPYTWRDDVVATAVAEIANGHLDKAVMSRRLNIVADSDIDIATVVRHLLASFPTAAVFNIEGFVGASPEILVSRFDDSVNAHPLAGTAARSADPEVDVSLVKSLLTSDKDRWEHKVTIDWLLETLLPFCSYVDAEPEPSVVTLANVHHLGTVVEGRLSKPLPSVLELVAALHPTPAVGGHPQKEALELIEKLEGEGRGQYAGPTGWVDAAGNGSFAVAIRTAQIEGSNAELRAGVGVVEGSDPESELEETRNKFKAMLGAILRP